MVKKDFDKIKLFIREGEGLTLEFKGKFTPRIDEDLVAFVNTKGGTLLLGVRDNGSISGERLTNDLKGRIRLREPVFEPDGFFRAIFHRSPDLALKEVKHRIEVSGDRGRVKPTQKSTQKPAQKSTQKSTQKTTQKQQAILVYLKDYPAASIREISQNVEGVTQNGVKSILLALREKGLLKRIGPDKGGYWEVVGIGSGKLI